VPELAAAGDVDGGGGGGESFRRLDFQARRAAGGCVVLGTYRDIHKSVAELFLARIQQPQPE
jgi:hypothetical protein